MLRCVTTENRNIVCVCVCLHALISVFVCVCNAIIQVQTTHNTYVK